MSAPGPSGARLRTAATGALLAALVLAVVVGVSTTIWPGRATATGGVLCGDDHPDAFVVRESYEVRDAEGRDQTSVRFSLVCVGPRGEVAEVGWLRPVAVVAVAYAVAGALAGGVARAVRGRGGPAPGRLVDDPVARRT